MSFVDFNRVFFPTPEQKAQSKRKIREIYDKSCKDQNCFTCKNSRFENICHGEFLRFCDLDLEGDPFVVRHNCDMYEQKDFGSYYKKDGEKDET